MKSYAKSIALSAETKLIYSGWNDGKIRIMNFLYKSQEGEISFPDLSEPPKKSRKKSNSDGTIKGDQSSQHSKSIDDDQKNDVENSNDQDHSNAQASLKEDGDKSEEKKEEEEVNLEKDESNKEEEDKDEEEDEDDEDDEEDEEEELDEDKGGRTLKIKTKVDTYINLNEINIVDKNSESQEDLSSANQVDVTALTLIDKYVIAGYSNGCVLLFEIQNNYKFHKRYYRDKNNCKTSFYPYP